MVQFLLRPALVFVGLLLPVAGFSQVQANVKVSPEILVPMGNPSGVTKDGKDLDLYSLGYGVDLLAELPLYGFLGPFLDSGFQVIPPNGVSGTSLLSGLVGGGVSVFHYPIPRLSTWAGLSTGLAFTTLSRQSAESAPLSGLSPYWKIKSEVGYRFSPTFSLLGQVGYSQLLGTASPFYRGLSLGVSAHFAVGSSSSGGIATTMVKQETILPINYYKYEKLPLGVLTVANAEEAEIQDVTVTFQAGQYTSRAVECGKVATLLRGQSLEVPVYAVFNEKVLGFSESTKIQGELKVTYQLLGAPKTASKAITVVFNHRNAATWSDPRVVGAFVSPQDPVMLELSKYLAGLVRVRARPEIDKNLQYAMGLFEGLRVYGLVWSADPAMPYSQARNRPGQVTYIQYPYQTLSFKSGDSDALALTLAEALESVAVSTALVPLADDVLIAFPLSMNEAQAKASFSVPANLIYENGEAWLPLRASLIRDGFLRAWQAGAELWRAQPASKRLPLVRVADSWKEFSPIALADVSFKPVKPAEELVNQAFDNVLGRFATSEVAPKVERIQAGIQGQATGKQLNSLGIVYAQYGLYDKAKGSFQKAADLAYTPAFVNLANVSFLQKDFEAAATYYRKALAAQAGNKAAMVGLARAQYELDDYTQADDLIAQVKALDPALADRYAYLSSKIDGIQAARASSAAADRGGAMTWDEDN